MKSLVLAGIAGLAMVSGCAPVAYTKADIDGRVICNAERMDEVERKAKKNHGSLHWVNCPQMTLRVS